MGTTLILRCNNLNIMLNQLTWKKNGIALFSFIPKQPPHISPEAAHLNISMSEHTLIIESAHVSHTGNYTCETATDAGALEKKWELIITGVLLSTEL